MNLRSPRYALLLAILVCLAVWMLTACAPVRSKPIVLVYENCQHRAEMVEVEIMASHAPGIDCVRHAADYGVNPLWFSLQIPVACAMRLAERALVILPFGAPVEMVVHELGHSVGLSHPPFMWGPMECPK